MLHYTGNPCRDMEEDFADRERESREANWHRDWEDSQDDDFIETLKEITKRYELEARLIEERTKRVG